MVHDLRQRLAPSCLPVFTSDGLNQYFYALTAHFGQWVDGVGRRARQWPLRRGADLRAGQEILSAPSAGTRHICDAVRDPCSTPGGPHGVGAERAGDHGVYRTP